MEKRKKDRKMLLQENEKLKKELEHYKSIIENINIVLQISKIDSIETTNVILNKGNIPFIGIDNIQIDKNVACHPESDSIIDLIKEKAQKEKKNFSVFYKYITKSGQKKWGASFCSPYKYTKTGDIAEIIIASIELSEDIFNPECYNMIAEDFNYLKNKHIIEKLTKSELEIIKLMADGKTEKEIADFRNRSLHTIKAHIKNIRKKLQISKNTELVKFAIKNGLH